MVDSEPTDGPGRQGKTIPFSRREWIILSLIWSATIRFQGVLYRRYNVTPLVPCDLSLAPNGRGQFRKLRDRQLDETQASFVDLGIGCYPVNPIVPLNPARYKGAFRYDG